MNIGWKFDLQIALGKTPGFIWFKYKNEHHYFWYLYFGLQTAYAIRLTENNQSKPVDKLVSSTDKLALHHDIVYRDAEKCDFELNTIWNMKIQYIIH